LSLEVEKALLAKQPSRIFHWTDRLALLPHLLPELAAMKGVDQGVHHDLDVFDHTLAVVDSVRGDLTLRWAALLHDVEKPATRALRDGHVSFHNHDQRGAATASRIMARFQVSARVVRSVARLIALHLRPLFYDGSWSRKPLAGWLRPRVTTWTVSSSSPLPTYAHRQNGSATTPEAC
jgi:putative nucleotidyltransferase with HDIG domain